MLEQKNRGPVLAGRVGALQKRVRPNPWPYCGIRRRSFFLHLSKGFSKLDYDYVSW